MSDKLNQHNGLEKWFMAIPQDYDFPNGVNCIHRLGTFRDYLHREVWPEIEKGILANQVKIGKKPLTYLNNHGEEHVNHVLSKTTEILKETNIQLSEYEAYYLLAAIYLHDTGNFYGRNEHEVKCHEILETSGCFSNAESSEKREIIKLASSHGGFIGDSRDTISSYFPEHKESKDVLGGYVRERLLAGLLRFADEIADDFKRASRFVINSDILEGSEVFHYYSASLKTSTVAKKEILLRYELTSNLVHNKLKKYDYEKDKIMEVYLFDEIKIRLLKMHKERLYCMKYFTPQTRIEIIKGNVEFFEYETGAHCKPFREQIPFEIHDIGYPDSVVDFHEVCPVLYENDGENLRGTLNS